MTEAMKSKCARVMRGASEVLVKDVCEAVGMGLVSKNNGRIVNEEWRNRTSSFGANHGTEDKVNMYHHLVALWAIEMRADD